MIKLIIEHQNPNKMVHGVHFSYSKHSTSYDMLVELTLASLAPSALAGEHRTIGPEREDQPGG